MQSSNFNEKNRFLEIPGPDIFLAKFVSLEGTLAKGLIIKLKVK